MAPTVIAAGTRAGDRVHASTLSFPTTTETDTPAEIKLVTAASTASEVPSFTPTLMFATAGLILWLCTQSIPQMRLESVPFPVQSNTRTGCRVTLSAAPYVRSPSRPATWVPWPLQSLASPPGVTASKPPRIRVAGANGLGRPANSL